MPEAILQEQVDLLARTVNVLLERVRLAEQELRRQQRHQHVHLIQSTETQTEHYGQLPMERAS